MCLYVYMYNKESCDRVATLLLQLGPGAGAACVMRRNPAPPDGLTCIYIYIYIYIYTYMCLCI